MKKKSPGYSGIGQFCKMLSLRKTGKGTQDHPVLFLNKNCNLKKGIICLLSIPLQQLVLLSSGTFLLSIPHAYGKGISWLLKQRIPAEIYISECKGSCSDTSELSLHQHFPQSQEA